MSPYHLTAKALSREEAHHMNRFRIRRVSSSLSKIPYSGFFPQYGFKLEFSRDLHPTC
jgi:hypothetical protein